MRIRAQNSNHRKKILIGRGREESIHPHGGLLRPPVRIVNVPPVDLRRQSGHRSIRCVRVRVAPFAQERVVSRLESSLLFVSVSVVLLPFHPQYFNQRHAAATIIVRPCGSVVVLLFLLPLLVLLVVVEFHRRCDPSDPSSHDL